MKTSEEHIPPPVDTPSHSPPESSEFSYATDEMGEIFDEWGDEQNRRRRSSPQRSHNNSHNDLVTDEHEQTPKKTQKNNSRNQAEELVRLCETYVSEFIKDQFDRLYVRLYINDHFELWVTSSKRFSTWLARLYRQNYEKPPTNQALKQAQIQIDAICYEKTRQTLHNRVARLDDKILYDLTNDDWECVEITADGFQIVPQPAIFRRFSHQLPQSSPIECNDIDLLWNFFNVPEDKRCVLAVLIATWFIPDISHPILILHGEPGTGKSTMSRMLRQLVDPSATPTLAAPRNAELADQIFDHNWLAPLDNLSKIPGWLSDMLCRVVTGEGSAKRVHYSNDDDFIRSYRRCVILNGIGNPAIQADLLDRSIVIELIPIDSLRTEEALMKAWEIALPRILGSIFRALSKAITLYPSILETSLPRMADFAKWGQAVASGLGYQPSQFMNDYISTIEQKWSDKIEDSPLATEILNLIDNDGGCWKGSRSELCEEIMLETNKSKAGWPKSPLGISKELTRLMPAFRENGIFIDRKKIKGGNRIIRIFRAENGSDELPF